MSSAVLESTFKNIFSSELVDPHLILLWHAGEPLSAGLPFFRDAVSLIRTYKPPSMVVEHSIQTNGTLLSDDWCKFLATENFQVGVSIDGPEFIHDRYRCNWAGRGSFKDVMAGITKLRAHSVEFGILSVLTADSLPFPDEMYDFLKSTGAVSVGFNVEEVENVHGRSSFSRLDSSEARFAYYRFFKRLLERIENDPNPLKIREVDHLLKISIRVINDPSYAYEPMEATPFRILTILQNGDVVPFSPEFGGATSEAYNNFTIGNICEHDLGQIADALNESLLAQHTGLSREYCRSHCKYFPLCGGAYFSNKWSENQSLLTSETEACRLHSQAVADAYFDHIRKD